MGLVAVMAFVMLGRIAGRRVELQVLPRFMNINK